MLLTPLASLLALAFAGVAISQDVTADQPPCFLDCGAKAAASLGCTGATDFACYCSKQQFMIENAKCTLQSCPDLALNSTVTNASFASLGAVCKAATGSFNLTLPTPADVLGDATTTGSVASTAKATSTSTIAGVKTTTTTSTHATAATSTGTNHNGASASVNMIPAMMGISLLFVGFTILA